MPDERLVQKTMEGIVRFLLKSDYHSLSRTGDPNRHMVKLWVLRDRIEVWDTVRGECAWVRSDIPSLMAARPEEGWSSHEYPFIVDFLVRVYHLPIAKSAMFMGFETRGHWAVEQVKWKPPVLPTRFDDREVVEE